MTLAALPMWKRLEPAFASLAPSNGQIVIKSISFYRKLCLSFTMAGRRGLRGTFASYRSCRLNARLVSGTPETQRKPKASSRARRAAVVGLLKLHHSLVLTFTARRNFLVSHEAANGRQW